MTEIERVENNCNGEVPNKGTELKFIVLTNSAKFYLDHIKEVVISIAKYNENNWPTDNDWDSILPKWFIQKIKAHSIEEIKQNSILWDYGSWLDAIKFRGWEWFSSKSYPDRFVIILRALNFPYSVNPLEYVIFESGIDISKITFSG